MNKQIIYNANQCYKNAEERAAYYFDSLYVQVMDRTFVSAVTKDIQEWKKAHIHRNPFFSLLSRRNRRFGSDYYDYIRWLDYANKLEPYLERSISYLYLRDLGKDLSSPITQTRVKKAVNSLKDHLTKKNGDKYESFSMAWLYRWGQREGIESTIIWLLDKLKTVSLNIPEGLKPEHAQRKLIKIIAGVLMHVMEEMNDQISQEERSQELARAIRLGYAYGLTYPFIDDLLDADILSVKEKQHYSNLIRSTLTTGIVPDLGLWAENNLDLLRFIHSELKSAFEYIRDHQHSDNLKSFFEQSYVFFHSQEVDRQKELSNPNYTNEELYIPIILKSSSSRLIVRSVISAPEDMGFDSRTFYYGIYNQLADDLADMFDDLKAGAVTPFTYYIKYHQVRPDLLNPFELYWTVISNLIHNVYHSDINTREVILDRAINGLKRLKERLGNDKYNEMMQLFAAGNSSFNQLIQKMVTKADDLDFFDKLLRDQMISILKRQRQEQEEFKETVQTFRKEINSFLAIPKKKRIADPITDGANYSLEGDGKRLRPIMTWVMGVDEYDLNKSAIIPLLKSLEYMHTASLIFDDLPSQDNASTRRGRPTLHKTFNIATAELTGLFLTQKAIEEQASLHEFEPKAVLNLIKYSTQVTEVMCRGQVMDLDSKGKRLTLEELNRMCFYKTGIAFEASLIMPAILTNRPPFEMEALKKYARHAGIAFQIKDDLLDVEGDQNKLGKPVGMDAGNNRSTFVTILGPEGARKEMWEHYCLAIEALEVIQPKTAFLKHLLNYIVNRDH